MPFDPSAFGPISAQTRQAATLLGAPAMPGMNLSRLTGQRSFGEPQQAAQAEPVGLATGSMAPIEEQQPLLPQGEATGERGDITQLPGFQAAVAPGGAAELPSSSELSQPEQQQASEFRNQLQRLAGEGGGAQTSIDAAKALQGLNKAVSGGLKGYKTGELASVNVGGTGGLPALSGAKPALPGGFNIADFLGSLGGTSVSNIAASTRVPYTTPIDLSGATKPGLLAGSAEPASASSAAGFSGAGLAGGAAGAVTAALPFLAQQLGLSDPYASAALHVGSMVGAPAAAGAAAGAYAGTGAAAGAGAGLAAASPFLVAAAPIVAGMIMQSILSAQDSKAAAREMTIRVKNITSQLPGEMQQIANVPTIVAGLNQSSTPEDAAKVLKQLNDLQTGFQQGGWEAYMKSGGTVVGGGNEAPDITANLSGVQTALDQLGPYFGLMDVSRVRAQDILSRAGWTPEQIQAQTGRYLNPTELALNANTQSYTHGDRQPVYSQFNPTLNAALRPASLQTPGPGQNLPGGIAGPGGLQQLISGGQADPSGLAQLSAPERQALGLDPTRGYTNQDLANFFAPSGAGAGLIGPSALGLGTTVKGVESQLAGLQPGNLEQGITGLLGQYGGVSPLWQQMGFGQGLPAPQAPVPTASPVTSGVPTDASSLVAGLQRLIGKTGGQAGALNPSVPSEFSTALQNPAALQSLLNQPGLLARLFQGGQ